MLAVTADPNAAAPLFVRLTTARLTAATGHPADLEPLGTTKWRLSMHPHPESTGARLQLDYSPNGRGIIRDPKARLTTADGTLCKPPKTFYEFLKVYYDLDKDGAFPRSAPTAMPDQQASDQAPPALRLFHTSLAQRLPDKVRISLGFSPDSGWAIGVDSARGGLRLYFVPTPYGSSWALDPLYGIQVVADGRDLSAQAAGNMAKAARLMNPRTRTAPLPDSGSAIGASSGPAATTSTQVRDTIVMRN